MSSVSLSRQVRDLLGPVRQVGFVTDDARGSALHWATTLGVGPWLVLDPFPVDGFAYRGTPQAIDLVIAVAFSGDVQIEFIQQRNLVPSVYLDVAAPGKGAVMHHCCHFPENYAAAQSALQAAGHVLLQEGGGVRGRFAYFHHPEATGYFVEIAERTPPRMQGFDKLRSLCANWDGDAPLREHL